MKEPMLYWGPDGQYSWNEGVAGFGQLQLYNTPESKNEKFPLTDADRGLIFFSAGRIDNRQELYYLLDIPNERKISITDAELMFSAYRKWDMNCTEHLLGDWIFLVWHKTEKKLVIIRDHHGISGLYYYKGKDFLVFSSSLKGILALPEVPKEVNELRIAQILVSWPGDGKDTAYLNIHRLPPAHFLTFQNKELTLKQYWFLEQKDLGIKKDGEYIEAFRELFTEAVRCRLRSVGKVGSTLSSGLDSSSVSVVAANLLKEQGIRLPVFTSAPKYDCSHLFPNRITDESILAAKTVEFNGNMDHYIFRSENSSVLGAIEKALWIHDQPIHAAGNAYWIQDMLELAKSVGCTTLLTGQGGNGTISWPTPDYTKWYYYPKKPEFKLTNFAKYLLFKDKIIKPLMPNIFFSLRNQIIHNNLQKHTPISISLAKRINIKKRIFSISKISDLNNSYKHRLQIIKPGQSIIGYSWMNIGAAFGIEVMDPTIDKRIINYCISVPHEIFFNNFMDRALVKSSMMNYFPEVILYNNKRAIQSSDLSERMKLELETLSLFFDSCSDKLFNIINKHIIEEYLNDSIKKNQYKKDVIIGTRGYVVSAFLAPFYNANETN
jgi:asparagine synthase (glutamine-hydrolysing)